MRSERQRCPSAPTVHFLSYRVCSGFMRISKFSFSSRIFVQFPSHLTEIKLRSARLGKPRRFFCQDYVQRENQEIEANPIVFFVIWKVPLEPSITWEDYGRFEAESASIERTHAISELRGRKRKVLDRAWFSFSRLRWTFLTQTQLDALYPRNFELGLQLPHLHPYRQWMTFQSQSTSKKTPRCLLNADSWPLSHLRTTFLCSNCVYGEMISANWGRNRC